MIFILFTLLLFFIYSIKNIKYNKMYMLPLFYAAICIYTIIGSYYFSFSISVPFDLYETINHEDYSVYIYYIIASVMFILGTCFVKELPIIFYREGVEIKADLKIYILYSLVVVMYHIGYGIENVYYRQGYTIGESGSSIARIIYMVILPLVSMLIAFLRKKNVKYILLFLLIIFVQGSSSRNLAIIPAFYFFGDFLRCGKISSVNLIFTIISILFFSSFSLEYRNNIEQGIIPNIIYFFENGVNLSYFIQSINYLTSYSIFSSATVIQNFPINIDTVITALNPLPSRYLDIERMIYEQRINLFSPYPAIATLSLVGWWFLCIYYLACGFVWKYLYVKVFNKNRMLQIFVLILFVLFIIMSTQYNLRSVTRLIYYAILLGLFCKVLRLFRKVFIT